MWVLLKCSLNTLQYWQVTGNCRLRLRSTHLQPPKWQQDSLARKTTQILQTLVQRGWNPNFKIKFRQFTFHRTCWALPSIHPYWVITFFHLYLPDIFRSTNSADLKLPICTLVALFCLLPQNHHPLFTFSPWKLLVNAKLWANRKSLTSQCFSTSVVSEACPDAPKTFFYSWGGSTDF